MGAAVREMNLDTRCLDLMRFLIHHGDLRNNNLELENKKFVFVNGPKSLAHAL